jgi:UDP-N-acetyl-D-galactosamine dehydrogenase
MDQPKIGIFGLGYVGLPLAVAFAQKYSVVGFDIRSEHIRKLCDGVDRTQEVPDKELQAVLRTNAAALREEKTGLFCTDMLGELQSCSIYIVTVPTPIDKYKRPVLAPLEKANEMLGTVMSTGDIIIYESTVYPGVTEEECVPQLERASGLTYNRDFFVGYSPERVNPGDRKHRVTTIKKVTSGSTPEIAKRIDELYASIITAGTFRAASIQVAEAAKVIENSQRDINIAFVNELAKIFERLEIDTGDVLAAAGTKWNFLPFSPGLVGGHCIGVDPYYLAQKAQEVGYHPEILLAGRRINDSMGRYVAGELVKLMLKKNLPVTDSRILILGFTFKENCPDVRNTRVIDIYEELRSYHARVDIYDPWADADLVKHEYALDLLSGMPSMDDYSGIVLAVAHDKFAGIELETQSDRVVYDVKGVLDRKVVDKRL